MYSAMHILLFGLICDPDYLCFGRTTHNNINGPGGPFMLVIIGPAGPFMYPDQISRYRCIKWQFHKLLPRSSFFCRWRITYQDKGYTYKDIRAFLEAKHGIVLSEDQLRGRLKRLGLRRRGSESSLEEVEAILVSNNKDLIHLSAHVK